MTALAYSMSAVSLISCGFSGMLTSHVMDTVAMVGHRRHGIFSREGVTSTIR